MDNAVLMVQIYLQVNGYFTVAETPVLAADAEGEVRTITDLDLLAYRFPGAMGAGVAAAFGRRAGGLRFATDPVLECPGDSPDLIVGEVKRGRARFNEAVRDPEVIAAALARFGCCSPEESNGIVRRLLQRGKVRLPGGPLIRMIAFGHEDTNSPAPHPRVIPIDHVSRYLREFLRSNWHILRHVHFGNPVFDLFAMLERAERNGEGPGGARAPARGRRGPRR